MKEKKDVPPKTNRVGFLKSRVFQFFFKAIILLFAEFSWSMLIWYPKVHTYERCMYIVQLQYLQIHITYCDIIEYSRTVKVKSHDLNGVVTILSSPNQKARPYQKGEHSRTFEMTTLSGSRENTSTGSS